MNQMSQTLLENDELCNRHNGDAGPVCPEIIDKNDAAAIGEQERQRMAKHHEVMEAKSKYIEITGKADWQKQVTTGIIFMLSISMSVYTGIKTVAFDNRTHHINGDDGGLTHVGHLMSLGIFIINLEFFLVRDYIEFLTKEEGELVKSLHMHPLYFEIGLRCHSCDVCHERMKGPYFEAYRCRACDFDLCSRCYRMKDNRDFKGLGFRGAPQSSGSETENNAADSNNTAEESETITTWNYFKRCLDMCVEFWPTLAMALGSLFACQFLALVSPNLQGDIFDALQKNDADRFLYVIKWYLITNVLSGFFNGTRSLGIELSMRKLAVSVRRKLFRSLVQLDIAYFDAMHTGQLTARLTGDASEMVSPMETIMNDLISNVILLVGGMFMSFYTSWKLSVLAITVVPPIFFVYRRYAKWAKRVNRAVYQAFGDANSVATECLQNIRTVRAFAAEHIEIERYTNGVDVALEYGVKTAFVGASVQAFSSYMNLLIAVLILWYGGLAVINDEGLTIGSLIKFQLYWNLMNNSFLSLGNVFNDLIRASSAAERVFSVMEVKPTIPLEAGERMEFTRGEIELRSVEFFYVTRPEKRVLQGVDLHLKPNTVTALVGKSGGGKSTIVHLLLRFYEPSKGGIYLDGVPLSSINVMDFRKQVGFVAQDTQLFAQSIHENLVYGLPKKEQITREEVVAAAKLANAHEFIMETEEGYETRVGEKGIRLSGGQKQRLALARCFLRRPKLLFLDEATSALDAENEAFVQTGIDNILKECKCTVVLIAHRLSTVMGADQIAVVNGGKIAEVGTHDSLVKMEKGIYAQLVSRQMARDANVINEKNIEEKGGKKNNNKTEIDELFEAMEEKK